MDPDLRGQLLRLEAKLELEHIEPGDVLSTFVTMLSNKQAAELFKLLACAGYSGKLEDVTMDVLRRVIRKPSYVTRNINWFLLYSALICGIILLWPK
jgi:hypothetical protein